ncbi:hypothetical protein HGRIS_011902 [Hohenbuehelia grisea]|uniref:Uncharacterized protein n=1 Tax=Hohenbuehelia grisea TaxID=104357 RepID=A0ABR3JWH2_9AGAR
MHDYLDTESTPHPPITVHSIPQMIKKIRLSPWPPLHKYARYRYTNDSGSLNLDGIRTSSPFYTLRFATPLHSCEHPIHITAGGSCLQPPKTPLKIAIHHHYQRFSILQPHNQGAG